NVSRDLLAHTDLRTTTKHYNRARGIEAVERMPNSSPECGELLTLNQRVQGSSPCAPTIDFTWPFSSSHQNIADQLGSQLGVFVRFSSFLIALSATAGPRLR